MSGKNNNGSKAKPVKLAPPSRQGTAAFLKTLRTWIELVEEDPGFLASSFAFQKVQARPVKDGIGDTFDYHTGRSEWQIRAIVVRPIPEDKRVAGREYAG